MWLKWKRALMYTLSVDGNATTLRTPLGQWHSNEIKRDEWKTLMSTDDGTMYNKREDGDYDVHIRRATGRNGTSTVLRSVATTTVLPLEVVPADMTPIARKRGRITQTQSAMNEAQTFAEYVAAQPQHIRRILIDCDLSATTASTMVEKTLRMRYNLDWN